MGGVNCDASDPFVQKDLGTPAQHKDSIDYRNALARYSQTQFDSYCAFLAVQSDVENLVTLETSDPNATGPVITSIDGKLAIYLVSITTAQNMLNSLQAESAVNFQDPDVKQFMIDNYALAVQSPIRGQALTAKLIPDETAEWSATSGALATNAEDGLFARHHQLYNEIYAATLELKQAFDDVKNLAATGGFQVAIRELVSPFIPFSLRSATLWTKLFSSQVYWAFLNMASLPSINGVDTEIDDILNSM